MSSPCPDSAKIRNTPCQFWGEIHWCKKGTGHVDIHQCRCGSYWAQR